MRKLAWSVAAGVVLGLMAVWVWWHRLPVLGLDQAVDRRPLVVIDAGHGGVDGGTQGFGVLEKRVALLTALQAARELRACGVRTAMTRMSDRTLSLEDRVDFVNEQSAVALVSVHFNFSTASAAVRGVEVFYSDPKELSAQTAVASLLRVPADHADVARASTTLADAVRTRLAAKADTPDRGTRNHPELALTRRTRCPAILVECAYLSNRADATRSATTEWQAALGKGIAAGVLDWLANQGWVANKHQLSDTNN